jgi:hypothetical protein
LVQNNPVNKFSFCDFSNMEIKVHNFEAKTRFYLKKIEEDEDT